MAETIYTQENVHRPRLRWLPVYQLLLRPLGRLLRSAIERITGERWEGSDAFSDYTARYTWIANQFGHSTVGLFFGVAAWVVAMLFSSSDGRDSAWLIALMLTAVLCVAYGAKEAADFLTEIESGDVPRPFFDHPDLRARYLDEIAADAEADGLFVVTGAAVGWTAGLTVYDAQHTTWEGWLLLVATGLWALWVWTKGRVYLPFMARRDLGGFRAYGRLARLQESFQWTRRAEPVDLATGINDLMACACRATADRSDGYCLLIVGSPGARGVAFANALAGDAMWLGAQALYLDRNRADLGNRPADQRDSIARGAGLICLDDFVGWQQLYPAIAERLPYCAVIATAAPDREARVAQDLADRGVTVTSLIHLDHLDQQPIRGRAAAPLVPGQGRQTG